LQPNVVATIFLCDYELLVSWYLHDSVAKLEVGQTHVRTRASEGPQEWSGHI